MARDWIPYRGERLPVLGTMKVAGREYLILKEIRAGQRRRLFVYQPWRGSGGEFRQIFLLPSGQTSRQHVRVLQRLSQGNPNLPTIIECVAGKDEFIIVTNWVHGQDLESYLEDVQSDPTRVPSVSETIRLYRGLAHGLTQMHRRRNVIHADIKPENLVFTRDPSRLVMIDFGSAWTVETSYRRVPGDGKSEHFAAPELQKEPPSVTSRSDQFSATVVAYRMLTGKLPYADMGGKAGLPEHRHAYEPLYKPPSQISPQHRQVPKRIWRMIDETIDKALALDPEDRFQTGMAWLEALEDIHCEMRRKPQFNVLDRTLMAVFRRFHKSQQTPGNSVP